MPSTIGIVASHNNYKPSPLVLYATLIGAGGSGGSQSNALGGDGDNFTVSIYYDALPTDTIEYIVGGPGTRGGTRCSSSRSAGAVGYGSGGLGGVGASAGGGDAGGSTMLRIKRASNILAEIVAGSGGGGGGLDRPGASGSFGGSAKGGSSSGGCSRGSGTDGLLGRGGGAGGRGTPRGDGGGGGRSYIITNDPNVKILLSDDSNAPVPATTFSYGAGGNVGMSGQTGALIINYVLKGIIENNLSFQGLQSNTIF